jgi:hypothetical protein
MLEMDSCIEWPESPCFERLKISEHCNYFEAKKEAAVGHIRQILFDRKFCVERMNCQFKCPVRKYYDAKTPFIEMLSIESVGAEGKKDSGGLLSSGDSGA